MVVYYNGLIVFEYWLIVMECLRYRLWSFLHQPAFRQDVDVEVVIVTISCVSEPTAMWLWTPWLWLFIDAINRQRDRKRDRPVFMSLTTCHSCASTFQNQCVRACLNDWDSDHSGVPSTSHAPCSFFKLKNNNWMTSSTINYEDMFSFSFHVSFSPANLSWHNSIYSVFHVRPYSCASAQQLSI